MNMYFGISWGISSVGIASASHAEVHCFNSCIIQPNILALASRDSPNIFDSRARETAGGSWGIYALLKQ